MVLLIGIRHGKLSFDYHDTFNPVVKPTTIRFVLNIAISHGWSLCQLDVNNVFLQGNLFEDVFMAQPLGFIGCNHLDHMCKLPKAIYGLKQVPHAWFHELRRSLITFSFTNSYSNTSLFVLNTDGIMVYFFVYVDDIIITSDNDMVSCRSSS